MNEDDLVGLSESELRALRIRLEVLAEFEEANHMEERMLEALERKRTDRTFRQRLGWNPGRTHPLTAAQREARRERRRRTRLQERLSAPPAVDSTTRTDASRWLASVTRSRPLSDPAVQRYWLGVCDFKISREKPERRPFWHACRSLVEDTRRMQDVHTCTSPAT
jgi:hypothetical protein